MLEKNKYLDIINSELDDIVKINTFGYNFTFLEGQRDVILSICVGFLEWLNNESDVDNVIVYAPTGYGKSIISMVAAKVLQRLGYGGYILTVDLMLQQQYENDFKKFKLNYHSIKGTDNYKCHENNESFKHGECHSMNLSYRQLSKLKCYSKCAYLQARNRAIRSQVSLMNYQYWLMQRNHVARKMDGKEPFQKRDFVFADECHKLDDIVQSSFAIKIEDDFPSIVEGMNAALIDNGYLLDIKSNSKDVKKILNVFKNTNDKSKIKDALLKLRDTLYLYTLKEDDIKEFMSLDVKSGDYVPDEWKRVYNIMDIFKDIQGKLEDYLEVTDEVGLKNIIVRVTDDYVEFVSLRDDFLIKKYFLQRSGFKILMSATLGDINKYAKIIGLTKTKVLKLKSRFSYDASPIHIVKGIRLDYHNKKNNLDQAIKLVDHLIATKHMDTKGIIHTASYEFTNMLMVKSKFRRRFINYNAKNKRTRIKKFLNSDNKILIGPSILEGLDLKNDLSRFQIFFKVPYPSLQDPLVKAKLKESQMWYDWKTSISVIQGSNRSIREVGDWSQTYMIDSCFIDLVKKKLFDVEFMQRFKMYDSKKDGFKYK